MGEKWANRSPIYNHDCKRDTKNIYGRMGKNNEDSPTTEAWSTK